MMQIDICRFRCQAWGLREPRWQSLLGSENWLSSAPHGVVGRGHARGAGKTHSVWNVEVTVCKSTAWEGGLRVLLAQMVQARLNKGC